MFTGRTEQRGAPSPRGRARGAAGFTLVEVLIAVAILGVLGVAVLSVSMVGVSKGGRELVRRDTDSSTVQLASTLFAGEV